MKGIITPRVPHTSVYVFFFCLFGMFEQTTLPGIFANFFFFSTAGLWNDISDCHLRLFFPLAFLEASVYLFCLAATMGGKVSPGDHFNDGSHTLHEILTAIRQPPTIVSSHNTGVAPLPSLDDRRGDWGGDQIHELDMGRVDMFVKGSLRQGKGWEEIYRSRATALYELRQSLLCHELCRSVMNCFYVVVKCTMLL